jgi:hypothetical protein
MHNLPAATQPELTPDFIEHLLGSIVAPVPAGEAGAETGNAQRHAAKLALLALNPADPFQAMLAAQAVAVHYAIMDAFRHASQPDLAPAMATRLRANAASLSRMMRSTLRLLRESQGIAPIRQRKASEQAASAEAANATPALPAAPAQPKARDPRPRGTGTLAAPPAGPSDGRLPAGTDAAFFRALAEQSAAAVSQLALLGSGNSAGKPPVILPASPPNSPPAA